MFIQLFLKEINEFTQWPDVNLIIIPVIRFCLLFLPFILFMIQYVVL